MNITCEIIRDLLPLYHDGVCSGDSRKLVEEHIAQCEKCRAELETMDDGITEGEMTKNISEADAVRGLSRQWKRGMLMSALKGVLFTLVSVAAVLLLLYCFMDIHVG